MKDFIEILANFASIVTAAIAAIAACKFLLDRRNKRIKLEEYLKSEIKENPNRHIHGVLHLMAKLGMTESEILQASFASKHIIRKERQ
ncbi:MAG: hypothetical protein JSS69_15000 [Acidobacteria bacterium]|nr:hypothetical protein [Acidobacteriota bacterium]MBS1867219.1 hypothetical protein [Acidobacteriota bacterium]